MNRRAVEHSPYEAVEGHIGPLAGAEDREVPESHSGHPVRLLVQDTEGFAGELRHPVGRDGPGGAVLPHGESLHIAVDRGGGGNDKGLQGMRTEGCCLQQPLGGIDVVRRVEVKILPPACAHSGLGRQVEDHVYALKEPPAVHFHKVRLEEGEGGMVEGPLDVLFLNAPGVVVEEGVDAPDGPAPLKEPFSEVRANEAGCTGHQRVHDLPLLNVGRPGENRRLSTTPIKSCKGMWPKGLIRLGSCQEASSRPGCISELQSEAPRSTPPIAGAR